MGHFWTLLTHLNSLAGPTVMLLYPLYASVVAIESPSKVDDEQWLSYWILYSFLTLAEMVLEPVLQWIPIWYQIKVLLVAWLVLPQFQGASFMYDRLVREQLRKYNTKDGKDNTKDGKDKCKTFVTPGKGKNEA
ncbi:Protein HVA22 [Acorus calamus]|uniref:HVA22-like protein n=1 Tax=Acorus calamus TaxID=4465 RepID=A0AAV9F229_ACOCL|nr:Protein HVA22 [Acorus calamus]